MVEDIIRMIEEEIMKGEAEIKRVEFMIAVLQNAGEDTTNLRTNLITAKSRLNQLKNALEKAKQGIV